jgi:hypothetical protein
MTRLIQAGQRWCLLLNVLMVKGVLNSEQAVIVSCVGESTVTLLWVQGFYRNFFLMIRITLF